MSEAWNPRIVEANAAHDADIVALGDMDEDQLLYLAGVQDLEDPVTDGIGCDGV